MKESKKDLFIAIDGNALVHRAFHAYPPTLSTSDGLQVNAVYGFTVMLLAMLKQFDPKYVVCAFDTAAPTFRHAKYAEYKGTRKAPEQSLIDQFPVVESVVRALNIPIIKKEGYEADDLLGTISSFVKDGKWSVYDFDMYLLTGDRDLLQLISDRVKVCMPVGSFSNLVVYDKNSVFERYGYYPEQVIDFKGIVGDASDNIPGVKGVGDKTAIELLKKYHTLEGIYKNLKDVKPRYANLLRDGIEQAEMSRDIATINCSVDFLLELDSCVLRDFSTEEVVSLFRKLEFKSLISKIPMSNRFIPKAGQIDMFSPNTKHDEEGKIDIGRPDLCIFAYIDEEDSSEVPFLVEIVSKKGKVSTKRIKSFTPKVNCETYVYNFEDYCRVCTEAESFDWKNQLDIKLLAYYLSSGKKSYSLSNLVFDLTAKTITDKVTEADMTRIGEVLVDCVVALKDIMKKVSVSEYVNGWITYLFNRFQATGMTRYDLISEYLDIPVAKILAKMENRGIKIDREKLLVLSDFFKEKIEKISKEIYYDIGHEFNLNSPKQLSDVLYTELGLSTTSEKSTREEILVTLKDLHPSISKILEYRELTKLQNTYVLPFLNIISNNLESLVHTDFKQTGSSSGRFSSVNPNMQNIPIRGEWSGKIRELFVPREGFVFVGADYSQIEFRVMADISEDESLISDFNNGKDIHMATAVRLLGKKEDEVTKEDRNIAKTINFAILFGQTPYGLSKLMGISTELAKKYIDEYFKLYPKVALYIERSTREATKFGYVQTMFGRTRYISGLASRNRNVYNAAVREAVNMPIQGGEADIMRLAMVDLDRLIAKKYENNAYILLQIHDELIFEVKESLADMFMKEVTDVMLNVVKLKVPLDVHISKGKNMAQLK